MTYPLAIAAIVLLLFVSAFFAGSETALTAVSRGRMHQMEKDGSRAAKDVNKLLADREGMIGALLLGNTFVNILISSLATLMLVYMPTFGPAAMMPPRIIEPGAITGPLGTPSTHSHAVSGTTPEPTLATHRSP